MTRFRTFNATLTALFACVMLGVFPQVRVHAAGFDGSGYVQIAPVYNVSGGNNSYLRLSNDGSSATTFTVKVVGSPSGTVYGTATIQIAAGTSQQYTVSDILTKASAGALSSSDSSYSFYLQDTDSTAFYQHAIYNQANGFFENMSVCKYASTGSYTGLNSRLTNVHTTQNGGYPGYVVIHNYASTSMTYNVAISDSVTGTSIGTVAVTVAANATNVQPVSWYQTQMNWTPTTGEYYVNMVFTAASGTYQADVSTYVYNSQLSGAYVNMTQRCPAAATANTTSSAATCPSANFLSVKADSHNSAYATPTLSVSCSTSQVTVTSNGIPNFEFVQTTPNALKTVSATYHLPLTPTVNSGTLTTAPLVGAEAVSVGGLPIYGPTESPTDGSQDPVKNALLDYCGGHTDQKGTYHHHYRPDCLFSDATKVGLVIGYAFDGYPILAPYECTDTTCKTTYKVHSSYIHRRVDRILGREYLRLGIWKSRQVQWHDAA